MALSEQPRFFVIGGAGFIGSHLVERLVRRGPVTVYDDLSAGKREFLRGPLERGDCRLIEGDARDLEHLVRALPGHSQVFHLSANPEARAGLVDTRLDLEQGTLTCYTVLEAMRKAGVTRIALSSSGTVYGDTTGLCREDSLGALPISLYGASKLASEALVSAYVECFGFHACILRFGNVIGPRATHGAALDFLNKLKRTPDELEVLGDGRQSKPYLHVTDCADGIVFAVEHARGRLNVFNLAPADATSVARIAELCVRASPNPQAKIRFTGGARGWPGDVPSSRLDPSRLARLGYRVSMTSQEAVERAVPEIAREVFACRP
jgi:UDP-glucose 4-epimerase